MRILNTLGWQDYPSEMDQENLWKFSVRETAPAAKQNA